MPAVAAEARSRAADATVVFYVHTLEHLRRGGRIGSAAALLGSALAIKPILSLRDGHIEPIEKVRTSSRALARMVELAGDAADRARMAGRIVDIEVQHLDFAATRPAEVADSLSERMARCRGDPSSGNVGRGRRCACGAGDPGDHGVAASRGRSVGMLKVAGALPLGPIQISLADVLTLLGALAAMTAVAFFWGGINPATLIGRMLGRDVTQTGSGNPGATNAGRVLGRKWGILVGVLDVFKGFLPAFLAAHFYGILVAYLLGIAAVLGHVFSPYLRGRGGKGVATALVCHPRRAPLVCRRPRSRFRRRVCGVAVGGAWVVGRRGCHARGRGVSGLWAFAWSRRPTDDDLGVGARPHHLGAASREHHRQAAGVGSAGLSRPAGVSAGASLRLSTWDRTVVPPSTAALTSVNGW
jgi:hypothetical protein